ncbi:MAG: hypothetical protein IAF94_12360 [Pirellulaceae bacterium]|nr:hypothetical protein [Pirellulaceae bacterium]
MTATSPLAAASSAKPSPAKLRRRWLQFSLRSLTIFMVVCSLLLAALGWRLQRARKQAEAVATIRAHGGSVVYDYGMQRDANGMYEMTAATPNAPPHMPTVLLNLLGQDFFCEVYAVYNAEPAPTTQRELEANWDAIGEFAHLKILSTSARGWRRRGTSLSPGIKNLAKTPEMQQLLIDQGKVDPLDLQVIGELRYLQELRLWGIEFDDAALESLVDLQELRVLEINASKVAMKGTVAISKLRNLEELQLQLCSIGDDEVALLGELSKLRRLTLAESQIGDRGLESIAKLQHLDWLDLPGATVGDHGMESLGQLP